MEGIKRMNELFLNKILPIALLALAGDVVLANAQTAPMIRFADTNGNVMTIDSTATIYLSGNCTPATCYGSAGLNQPTAGAIDFSGVFGGFTILGAQGQTNQGLNNETDLGLGQVFSNSGGQLTASLTVTGVSVLGPLNLAIINNGANTMNTVYVDPSNTPFGTGGGPVIQLNASSNMTACPAANCVSYAGSSKSSVTEVAVIQVGGGGYLNSFSDDLAFYASSFQGQILTLPLTPICPVATGTVGLPYASALSAVGGKAPYKYSITGGSLVPGVSLTNAVTGTLSGTPTAPGTFNFTASVLDSSGNSVNGTTSASCAVTTNPVSGSPLAKGDAATIGFWHNKNGQALINEVNGGPTSTALATWLSSSFPYLFGPKSAHDLTGKTNKDVAVLDSAYFLVSGSKTYAQMLGVALATYMTDTNLAGTSAVSFGFNTSAAGTGAKLYNVGASGPPVGLLNQSYTVFQLLQQANLTVQNGTFNGGAYNTIFDGINQTGDII
jgi:hypothetical protein